MDASPGGSVSVSATVTATVPASTYEDAAGREGDLADPVLWARWGSLVPGVRLRKEHSPAPVLRLPAVQFERVPPALSLGFLCLLEGDTPPPSDAHPQRRSRPSRLSAGV